MAKVDIETEMVNEHSTKEILLWMEQMLRRCVTEINDGEADPVFLLGQISVVVKELRDVAIALNTKLNFPSSEGPVVAG